MANSYFFFLFSFFNADFKDYKSFCNNNPLKIKTQTESALAKQQEQR